MCVAIPFILEVEFVDVPAGVEQEEGHTGFLHLPSAVLALIFYLEKDSAVPFPRRRWSRIMCANELIDLHLLSIFFFFLFVGKNPSSCDDTEIRTLVPTSEGFEVTNWTTGATGSNIVVS